MMEVTRIPGSRRAGSAGKGDVENTKRREQGGWAGLEEHLKPEIVTVEVGDTRSQRWA